MPWPKRTAPGSCLFCRQVYDIANWHQGPSWCRCLEADKERKRIKNNRNRFYYLQARAKQGITVNPNQPRGAKDGKSAVVGKQRSQYRIAKHCGHLTKNNYFNCETCQSRLESNYNLDYLIDDLDSRWNGARI